MKPAAILKRPREVGATSRWPPPALAVPFVVAMSFVVLPLVGLFTRTSPVDVVHLHHAVWLNLNRGASSYTPFFATGEEKTISTVPPGYGYPTHPSDAWIANYMLHNLTPTPHVVFLTYDLDFIPARTVAYNQTRPVQPVLGWPHAGERCVLSQGRDGSS